MRVRSSKGSPDNSKGVLLQLRCEDDLTGSLMMSRVGQGGDGNVQARTGSGLLSCLSALWL